MSSTTQELAVQNMFTDASENLASDTFTQQVMVQTDHLKYRKIARRVLLGLLISLLAIPLKDFGVALGQSMLINLVDINHQLLAQMLTPVNTVGSLLSIVLFGLRLVHKRLFV